MANALSPIMTVRDFENGYWYLDQLKNFAENIGIPAAKKLRKDELEKAIVAFLRTGKAALPTKRSVRKTGVKDVERGLNLKLRIENYTSNRETKDFIVAQARMMAPDVREKSGVWYRLNRWREEQSLTFSKPTKGRREQRQSPRGTSSRSSTSPKTTCHGSRRERTERERTVIRVGSRGVARRRLSLHEPPRQSARASDASASARSR